MSKTIAVNNSIAKDHAERMRRETILFRKSGNVKHSNHEGYTAIADSEVCHGDMIAVIPKLKSKLAEDCENLTRVADVWKEEDKYFADNLTVSYAGSVKSHRR